MNTFTKELVTNLNKNVTRNYSGRGWEGKNYDSTLRVKDIAKIVRDYVKTNYPSCKFSVRKEHYSSLSVTLVSAPFDVFSTPDISKASLEDLRYGEDDFMNRWNSIIRSGHFQVNHYYINESRFLSDKAKEVLTDINNFVNSFNYDDSDAMVDYFDTNFYFSLSIGKWNKPFIKTN